MTAPAKGTLPEDKPAESSKPKSLFDAPGVSKDPKAAKPKSLFAAPSLTDVPKTDLKKQESKQETATDVVPSLKKNHSIFTQDPPPPSGNGLFTNAPKKPETATDEHIKSGPAKLFPIEEKVTEEDMGTPTPNAPNDAKQPEKKRTGLFDPPAKSPIDGLFQGGAQTKTA